MKRSKFSLSHYKLLTCDMGELIPTSVIEVLPGDTIQQATSALVRVSPLLAPVMHPVQVRLHHWFVPHRLVWEDFEDFITGGPDGMDASSFPVFSIGTVAVGELQDYLGIPLGTFGGQTVSALPARGYQLIWNENYRDQDLQTAASLSIASGADTTTTRALQNVGWEKDYFTTARPWTQKGPEVTIPIGGSAAVVSDGTNPRFTNNGATNGPLTALEFNLAGGGTFFGAAISGTTGGASNYIWGNNTGLEADLSTATSVSINDLREAMALQRYEEARARYGSRYTEYLAYLGVKAADARLQRPEYLGGGKQTIQFSEVLQTGPDTSDEGVANLLGHGIGALRSNRYRRFFPEHGYVFTLMSVKPKTMYSQGLPRSYNRRTKEDFFQRELQHIGQQEVLNKEIYLSHASPDAVFGYQDRYDEYRRMESGIAGEFRDTLDFWHYARIFSGAGPSLNADFVKSVPTKRVNAVDTTDCLWVMVNHSIQARRLVAGSAKSFIY